MDRRQHVTTQTTANLAEAALSLFSLLFTANYQRGGGV